MRHYRTRSVVAWEQDRIQRASEPHPDAEKIKGDVTTTGLGVHLRWEYPEPGSPPKPGEPPSTPSRPSRFSHPRSSLMTPLAEASSRLSIASTLCSTTDDEDMVDSRPQTPDDEEPNYPQPRVHTSFESPCPRRLQRNSGRISSGFPWAKFANKSDDLLPMPIDTKRVEHDLRIGAEQLKKLNELKKAREEQWEQAAEAGLFDDLETSDDETEDTRSEYIDDARVEAELFPTSQTQESMMASSSRSLLGRTDTIRCSGDEPPSKLRPTLPEPLLPYFRTETHSSFALSSSTCMTSTMSTIATNPTYSSISSSSTASTSSPNSRRFVRRYQENGVWKTAGTFKDLPALAHLESVDPMRNLEASLPPISPRTPLRTRSKGKSRLEAWRVDQSPFTPTRTRPRSTSDAATREPGTPNPRLRAAPRHSF